MNLGNSVTRAGIEDVSVISSSVAPREDWRNMQKSEHFVQFYEEDDFLVESVSQFIGAALGGGEGAIVIATPAHRRALDERLHMFGLNLSAMQARDQYIPLDAAETLAKFMVNGSPDQTLFNETIGAVLARVAKGGRGIRAFGEMVALLWAEGKGPAAIRLEELWNDLSKTHTFSLFCAYPIEGFRGQIDGQPFTHICDKHSRVIPAESYTAEPHVDGRLRSITLLQQKAISLTAEIKAREHAESATREQETKLAMAVNLAGLAIWDLNLETYAIDCSKEFKALLGWKADESLNYQELLALIHPNDRRRVSNALHTALANNGDYEVDYRLIDATGKLRWLAVMGRYFRNDCGQRMLCVTRDITEQKRAAEILGQTSSSIST